MQDNVKKELPYSPGMQGYNGNQTVEKIRNDLWDKIDREMQVKKPVLLVCYICDFSIVIVAFCLILHDCYRVKSVKEGFA